MNFLKKGKVNIIIDGQFGSTGKGLIAAYLASKEHIDVAVSNTSPNAGHTFYIDGKKYVTRHLPVAGVINKDALIYLCAGSIIDPEILSEELELFKIEPSRLIVHPRAAVIEEQDRLAEQDGAALSIASTQKGVGNALMRKISRAANLAGTSKSLKKYTFGLDLTALLSENKKVLMETSQGVGLALNSGLAYPYCTSREITVSAALADAQVHPNYLGNVMACIRTYPIRVGNIERDGALAGYSGPFYPDSVELTWEQIGVPREYTTNTKRVRRVASFSFTQYRDMLRLIRPTHVFLNFANYLNRADLDSLLMKLPEVTHLGFGPKVADVIEDT